MLIAGRRVEIVPEAGATVSKEAAREALAAAEKSYRATQKALELDAADLPKEKIRIAVRKDGAFDPTAVPRALLAQTVGPAAPLWLSEGIAMRIAGEADAIRKDLRENEFSLEWEALLTETDPEAFAANRGPALAWALVSLLHEARPELVVALHDRCRRLAAHLAPDQEERKVRRAFTGLVNRWMKAGGATEERLRKAVTDWVAAGFPTGAAFRRAEIAKSLRGLTLPGTHSVTLKGTFQNMQDIAGQTGRLIEHPEVVWRLPFKSRMKLWVGLRGSRSLKGNPVARNQGMMGSNSQFEWDADPTGSRKPVPLGVLVPSKRGFDRYGIMLLRVTEPGGVEFLFFREWPVR